MLATMAFHVNNESVDKDLLRCLQPQTPDPNYVSDLLKMSDEIALLLKHDGRSLGEIVGYDDSGLPC